MANTMTRAEAEALAQAAEERAAPEESPTDFALRLYPAKEGANADAAHLQDYARGIAFHVATLRDRQWSARTREPALCAALREALQEADALRVDAEIGAGIVQAALETRGEIEALAAERTAFRAQRDAEERAHAKTLAKVEYYEDEIARLAALVGCEQEWTNLHAHATCIDDGVAKLERERDAAIERAERAEALLRGVQEAARAVVAIEWQHGGDCPHRYCSTECIPGARDEDCDCGVSKVDALGDALATLEEPPTGEERR